MRSRVGLAGLGIVALLAGVGVSLLTARADPPRDRATDPAATPGADAPPRRNIHAQLHGSTIALDGTSVWSVEAADGVLVRSDRSGRPRASLQLSPGLGELVVDVERRRVFVADRAGDRIVRVPIPAELDGALQVEAELELREPHGLALSPDGATLLVTSVANGELVAVSSETFKPTWRIPVGPEPRAVAFAPDGSRAAIGFLTMGALLEIDSRDQGRALAWTSLEPDMRSFYDEDRLEDPPDLDRYPYQHGRFAPMDNRHAIVGRNVFALAYAGLGEGPHELLAAHRASQPWYAIELPIERYRVRDKLVNQMLDDARSLAVDVEHELLYAADATADVIAAWSLSVERQLAWEVRLLRGCGPDGIAVADDGPWIHCANSHRLIHLQLRPRPKTERWLPPLPVERRDWMLGPTLVTSTRAPEVEQGAELFRRAGDPRLSAGGRFACSSCHPEGRSDGVSWRMGDVVRPTPILAGRVEVTRASLTRMIDAIGGNSKALGQAEVDALLAYLASLPPPRPPERDAKAVARGRALFDTIGCADCHAGPRLAGADVPSLIGLAHSAPYLADGSAQTLHALLEGRANVIHTEASMALADQQIDDLVAFLEAS